MPSSQDHHDFSRGHLDVNDLDPDPMRQLSLWLDEAVANSCAEPYAMTLSTATAQGRPSSRIVYLKGLSQGNLQFFTNSQSRKGQELRDNPWASALLFWPLLERQVRIEGVTSVLPSEQSDAYFAGRPQESQWGAWASQQSRVISDRDTLEQALRDIKSRYPQEVPRPPHWGGYRLAPETFEFWQGRPGRLHDRLRYRRIEGQWGLERLSP